MTWIVLAIVAAFQLALLRRSWTLAREDDTAAFDELLARFLPDLVNRAKRGDAPDWLRYMDEADRVHEGRSEKLRVNATAALVIGMGGTMIALALHLLFIEGSNQSLGSLIAAMSSALVASLSGVVNNLLITLRLLPQADERFTTLLQRFKRQLHEASSEHPPQETFAEAVKSQLGNAFREAVQKFPEAFERLGQHVESLASEIERQSTTVLSAATQLRESADGLANAASGIAPAATGLAASTDQLRGLPEQIRTTLDATRDAWEQEIRRDQNAFIAGVTEVLSDQQALLESTRSAFHEWEEKRSIEAERVERSRRESDLLIRNTTAEIVSTVNTLPSIFATEVEKVSNTLGRQFGLEARNYVQDLVQRIAEENQTLRTQIDRVATELQTSFLNSTSDVVSKTLQDVYQRVENTLLASLDEVGKGLREALTELPNNAATFAQSLTDADERIKQALNGIKESSDHLARVATLTEDLEASLTAALTKATADGVEPLRRDVQEFVSDLQRTHEQLYQTHTQINSMVEGLIEFIRNLIDRLAHPGDSH